MLNREVLVEGLLGRVRVAVAIAGLLGAAVFAEATVIPVGSGANEASVQVDFADGASYTFFVSFDGAMTGMGLLDVIEANTTLIVTRSDFGWGAFVDGFTYDGHSNVGYAGGENWWHYWVKEAGESSWTSPSYGAATRAVADGSSDGWVYGRAGAPIPEPAAVALIGAASFFVLRRSRRAR